MMIDKVLIANRGEIALRILHTCKALGIQTVAVYSDEDKNSLHVKHATESYHIGEGAPSKSYLNQEKIIEAAIKSGADSVHPGYGFLSSSEYTATVCMPSALHVWSILSAISPRFAMSTLSIIIHHRFMFPCLRGGVFSLLFASISSAFAIIERV